MKKGKLGKYPGNPISASENVKRQICVQNKTRFLCVNQKRILL
jgi:hypothetical protein